MNTLPNAGTTKKLFDAARARTRAFIGEREHMFYGPTTDLYWEAPTRLLFINLEAYGYEGQNVDATGEIWDWLYNPKSRTVRYSMTLSAAVLAAIRGDLPPTSDLRSTLQANYQDRALLERTLATVCYWNLRPTCNWRSQLDWQAVWDSAANETAPYIVDELKALAPHVVIFSAWAGLHTMRRMDFVPETFKFLETAKLDGVIYASIHHPSRPKYAKWAETVTQTAALLRDEMDAAA
jgi:hypothetical protein